MAWLAGQGLVLVGAVVRWSGREARALREAKRMSVREFAAHLGVNDAAVSKWERRGELARLRYQTQQILDVDLARSGRDVHDRFELILLAGRTMTADPHVSEEAPAERRPDPVPDEADGAADAARSTVEARLPALRRVLDAHDIPDDGPARPLEELQRAVAGVVGMRLESNYHRLVLALPLLLPELTRALDLHVGQRRAEVARLLVQAYRAADAIADKFGFYDLSARIIGLMSWAAAESGDEIASAAAAYVRAEIFFANGDLETGRRMLGRAAERLLPESGVDAAAAYGALHMRAAVLAARAGRLATAGDHVAEARLTAGRVPEAIYHGTAFGSASVRIHQLTLALDSGDPDAAVRTAAGWTPPSRLPAERRSHFYVDLARARAATDQPELSLDALTTARRIAPEHIRVHPDVHRLLGELRSTGLARSGRLVEFAEWAQPTATTG